MNENQRSYAVLNAATGEPIRSAMQQMWLGGRILPVGARLVVKHVFESAEETPLEAIYAFALPRDGALSKFRVEGEGFSITSDLEPRAKARHRYEEGMEKGHLAAMTQIHRDGLANLNLGNIRPGESITIILEMLAGVDLRDDGLRFRFPFTMAPCYHADMRAVSPSPGTGEIELPAEKFGDVMLPRWHSHASNLHGIAFQLEVDLPGTIRKVGSPSHRVNFDLTAPGQASVSLSPEQDLPNRDLVLDITLAGEMEGAFTSHNPGEKTCLAAVIPSTRFGTTGEEPRRVVFTLDRSGSMEGRDMEQAKRALQACLGALDQQDQFGLLTFDSTVDLFDKQLRPATIDARGDAENFLATIDARGGTDIEEGLNQAANLLGTSAGDIVVITDGQVYGGEEIMAGMRKTPHRIHTLGIGSASQDRFLSLLARETGGTSRFQTPRERVDIGALELFASIGRPVAQDVSVEVPRGWALRPDPFRHVFQGQPLVLWAETRAAGPDPADARTESELGRFQITWGERSGKFSVSVADATPLPSQTLRLLQGAQLITDLESRTETRERPRAGEEDADLIALAREFDLANQSMGLVAVVKREGDQAGSEVTTRVVPVGLPEDLEIGEYFEMQSAAGMVPAEACFPDAPAAVFNLTAPSTPHYLCHNVDAIESLESHATSNDVDDFLFDLASRLEPDGGMPGDDTPDRIAHTLLALLAFAAAGHSEHTGAFRSHVVRLRGFLQEARVTGLDAKRRELFAAAMAKIDAAPGTGAVEEIRTRLHVRSSGWEPLEDILNIT